MPPLSRLRKLSKMSASEIRWRAYEIMRRRSERRRHRLGLCRSVNGGATCEIARDLLDNARCLVRGYRREEIEKLQAKFPDVYSRFSLRARDRAERIVSGSWELLGRPIDLSGRVLWHRDPVSTYCWPRVFYADVPLFNSSGDVDVKYVWELNRHQFLCELARGWAFLQEDRYAVRTRELMLDWIEQNPLYEGVNWTSALEVAMRAISWLWTLAGLADWPGWIGGDVERIAGGLADHGNYLEAHLSLYSSPYNHLIGEATALYLLGRWLVGSEQASGWEQLGQETLLEYGPKQFYADGISVEQAVGYHFFTLGFLSHALAVPGPSSTLWARLESTIARAFLAGSALKQPDRRWPAIGDVDSARSIPVLTDDFWDFRSLCSLGAVLCQRPELKAVAETPGEELYWLSGTRGLEDWLELPSTSLPDCIVLRDSGYAVAKASKAGPGGTADGDWLLFDAGPIAEGLFNDATPSTAHGHLDALQLLLFLNGRAVLADAGISHYFGQPSWAEHFRSAAAHNTLELVGAPLARVAGPLAWSNACQTPRLDANLSRDVWLVQGAVECKTYSLERNVLGLPGRGVWVADVVRLSHAGRVRWYWQVAETPVLRKCDSTMSDIQFGTSTLLSWSSQPGWRCDVDAASPGAPFAWSAPGYGTLRAGHRVRNEIAVERELIVVHHVCAGEPSSSAAVYVGGTRLDCAPREFPAVNSAWEVPQASVIWQISAANRTEVYAAGVRGEPPDARWSSLAGVGGWSAVSRVFAPDERPVLPGRE